MWLMLNEGMEIKRISLPLDMKKLPHTLTQEEFTLRLDLVVPAGECVQFCWS